MAGDVEFRSKQVAVMGSGSAVSIWEVFWKNGRDQMSELASNFSLPVVKGIVQQLIDDPDPVMRGNVKPHNMGTDPLALPPPPPPRPLSRHFKQAHSPLLAMCSLIFVILPCSLRVCARVLEHRPSRRRRTRQDI